MKLMRRGAIRLRPSIVMLFVLMVLPVFSAAIWVGYVSNDRMARDTANKTVERARLETIAQTEALLDPIASLVRVTAALAAEQPDFFRSDRALAPMMKVLDHSANISSVYLGFADGSYRMALRIPPGFRVQGSEPPKGAQFASRWIDRRAGAAALDRYAFFDKERHPVGTLDTPGQYDPRVRPWFKDAVERRDLVISNPYIYATTGLPGVTVAMPIYSGGQLVGVLAIDILLDSLSQYLKTRPVSAHSTSLIVDREGYIVAHPDTQQGLKREASGGVVRVRINELADPRPALAFGMRAEKKQGNFTFMHDGDEEVALFSNFPPEFGKPWEVVIIAPLDDFVGEWKSNNRKLLLFGLVAILLQVLIIYYLSRRIAKPLELLEHQVQEVEQFSMRRHEPVHSPIREIASLAAAVDTLHSAIGAFSVFVPRELVKLLIASRSSSSAGAAASSR
jgi:adenylate cyclase